MGDHFQIIADAEATEAEAPALGASVVSWLASEGIIGAEPTDCVLSAEPGYPPGPRYIAAVTGPSEWLPRLRTNGLAVITTRSVFHPIQGELGPVACPHCGQTVELEDPATGQPTQQWERFSDALNAWMSGDACAVACPRCRQVTGFNDWHWTGDWPFAVGFLGFKFWNWPPLRESFITQMASQLGHRVVVTRGKL